MSANRDFKATQIAFAAHLRDPSVNPPPQGIENRRMKIYRDLFYNNIESLIAGNFPVLRKITRDDVWHSMVRDFYARHRCHTPYFSKIPEEFLAYLQNEREPIPDDFGFMIELAHYEYMEVVIDCAMETIPATGFHPDGDMLNAAPLISPLVCVLGYHWPVHKISEHFIPEKPLDRALSLLVYRNRDEEVKFMEINPVTARLLLLLQGDEMLTGYQALKIVHTELGESIPWQQIKDSGLETMEHLRSQDIVLGTRLEPVN